MVHNEIVECELCGTSINLRIQIGSYSIPFIVNCPYCHSEVSGEVDINNKAIGLSLINLVNIERVFHNEVDLENIITIELSAEFMTQKMCPRKNVSLVSPFLRSANLFTIEGDELLSPLSDAAAFIEFENKKWNDLKAFYNLFWNDKDKVLLIKLLGILSQNPQIPLTTVNSKLDAFLTLHQYLMNGTGILRTLPEYSRKKILKFPKLVVKSKEHFISAFEMYGKSDEELIQIEIKALDLIDEYKKFHKYILPIIAVKKAGTIENIDFEKNGISTVSYEELKKFYANTFEWILDNIDIVIILNNYSHRGDGDICTSGKRLSDLAQMSKFSKIDFIDPKEQFSILISSLNNKVRNAIQHYDTDIDYNDQKVTFTNTNQKGKKSIVTIYFSEFANLCIDNFIIVLYLNEVLYQYRKIRIYSEEKKKLSVDYAKLNAL